MTSSSLDALESLIPLALGCAPLGLVDMGPTDLTAAKRAVAEAYERGIRAFDTADIYGLGRAEAELSDALGTNRHAAFIISKFGVRWSESGKGRAQTFRDSSAVYARTALEASLRRLRVEAIPLYLVHWPDPNSPLEDTLEFLGEAQRAGKIINFGLSNFGLLDIRKAKAISSAAAIQDSYSLIEHTRTAQHFTEARELGLKTLSYGALGQGMLSGSFSRFRQIAADDRRSRLPQFQRCNWDAYSAVVSCVKSVAESRGVPASQVALRWVLDSEVIDMAVVGVKSTEQLTANLGALDWTLDAPELNVLDQARHDLLATLKASSSNA